jgi:uncharacterized membrane protein
MKQKSATAAVENGPGDRIRKWIHSIAAIIALLGLAETTYLTASHLAGAHVVCVASTTCDQVLGSVYASFKGIPLAGVGAFGYFTVFSLAILAVFNYRRASLLLALVITFMFMVTLYLLYLQAFVLHAFCDYCLFSAALIFVLAGLVIALPPPRDANA